jgi:hypothetical protein
MTIFRNKIPTYINSPVVIFINKHHIFQDWQTITFRGKTDKAIHHVQELLTILIKVKCMKMKNRVQITGLYANDISKEQ